MANIINQTIINEGNKYATVQFYLESDGNEGELVNRVVLDPYNDFNIPIPPQLGPDGRLLPPELTIREVWFGLSWFDVIIGWESTNPTNMLTLTRDADRYYDFRSFGGVRDRTVSDFAPTGRMLFTTKDFAPLGSSGHVILEIRKN